MSTTDALLLNRHELFAKIREGLKGRDGVQELLACKDDLLYAWDATDRCVLIMNWRISYQQQANINVSYQALIPSAPLNFDVEHISVSKESALIALIGPRGITTMELPRRWGRDGIFMDGKKKITCRVNILDAAVFSFNRYLQVLQFRWHPGSVTNTHFMTLLSDNTIRLYNRNRLELIWRVGKTTMPDSLPTSASCVGEFAVDFDIAPPKLFNNEEAVEFEEDISVSQLGKMDKVRWPMVILRENGNIYVLMTSMDTENATLYGPLTMSPQTFNNYGLESCAVLVIPSLPPTIVIAESHGKLHHALLLDVDKATEEINEIDQSLIIYSAPWKLHVLETIELELGLPKESMQQLTPISLQRDDFNELRYFAYHNTGLHAITLNYITELKHFLEHDIPGGVVTLSAPSKAEYIVCTKIDANEKANSVLGFVLLQLPSCLVILLSSGQVISLRMITDLEYLVDAPKAKWHQEVSQNNSNNLESTEYFAEHIKQILQRPVSQPILLADKSIKPTTHESFELLQQAVQVFRANYFNRHEIVRKEFAKHMQHTALLEEQQRNEIDSIERERKIISDEAHKLADRFDEISYNQEVLMKKYRDLLRQANISLPGNVAAGKEFKENVQRLSREVTKLASTIKTLKKSTEMQRFQIEAKNQCNKSKQSNPKKSVELAEKQKNVIMEVLRNMSYEIDVHVKEVKQMKKLLNM